MSPTETEPGRGFPKLRWYQYRLRTLLLLFPLVALVTGAWVSRESLRVSAYPRGKDVVISTSRFEIVVKGAGDTADFEGWLQVGGPGWSAGGGSGGQRRVDGKAVPERSYFYCWGTLSYRINGARFSFRNHAREVVANGRTYRIQNRAIITIDRQGGITVEDRPLAQQKRP